MKRWISIVLCCLLISGCSISGERIKEPVRFYYLRNSYEYQSIDGVISSEEREASGHRNNLSYLLALYRMGPSNEDLCLPFPAGTAILMMDLTDEEVRLVLGSNADSLSDAEFSLACACLTLTCTELVDVERVTVVSGERSITMTRGSLALVDSSMTESTEDSK